MDLLSATDKELDDFSKEAKEEAENGFDIEIRHPDTFQKLGFTIKIKGILADGFISALQEAFVSEEEAKLSKTLASYLIGWRNHDGECKHYSVKNAEKLFNEKPYPEASILPKRSQRWGAVSKSRSRNLFLSVNLFAIVLSGTAAIAVLLVV